MRTCTKCGKEKPPRDFYEGRNLSACRECYRAYNRAWYKRNREYKLARNNQWNRDNPIKARAGSINSDARRHKAKGLVSGEDLEQIVKRWNDRCAYCLGPWEEFEHVVALSQGGRNERKNIVLSCHACNRKKSKRSRSLVPSILSEFWPPSEDLCRPWGDWRVSLNRSGGRWV